MITFKFARKSFVFAGVLALAAIATVFPLDAFAQVDIQLQSKQLASQASTIPQMIAIGLYIVGAFFIAKCLFALKGFISEPDDNPITGVLAFGAIGALMIVMPYIIQVFTNSILADGLENQTAAADKFAASGDLEGMIQ